MFLGLVAAAVFLAVQQGPDAPGPLSPPNREDAAHARNVVLMLEHIDRTDDRSGTLAGSAQEWSGLFRILARSEPRLRGTTRIEDEALVVAVTLGLPRDIWPGELSLRAVMPPFDGQPRLASLRIGRLPLPPGLMMRLTGVLVDRRFGSGTMDAALASLRGVSIVADEVRFDVVLPSSDRVDVLGLLLRGPSGQPLPDLDEVTAFITEFERRVATDALPRRGSFLPWLQATLDIAIDRVDVDDPERTLLAVFMALDRLCGSGDLARLLPPGARTQRGDLPSSGICGGTGLHDRADLRQHFVTAGTVRLLSNRGVAVTAGEVKELSDLDGSGFDFTDVAGNHSGIRFVALLAQTPPEDWPGLRRRITEEADVMAGLDGLPHGMSPSAFRTRFGDIDSPAHTAMIDEIESRIDRLPIHSGTSDADQGG